MCNLFNTPPPVLLPCPLLAALFLFRATLLFLLLRLLEHGEIAFHALAFCGTPALNHLGPNQMLNVLGGDRRSGVQMHPEVKERPLLSARRRSRSPHSRRDVTKCVNLVTSQTKTYR